MRAFKRGVQNAAEAVLGNRYVGRVLDNLSVDKGTQILLSLKYQEWLRDGRTLPSFDQVGFRAYSQTDEDGILLFIFSLIGTTNKQVVELCVEQGIECNAANLLLNHGWRALLFDGSLSNVKAGRRFYARHRSTWLWPPTLVQAWIEAENVDSLISHNGVSGEIDLLAIDIDGMDYWIWDAIRCVSPRVVIVEFQGAWGPDRAVVVPYDRAFDRNKVHPDYYGASLAAFVKLACAKGYRLVGVNQYGFNAFFVRQDIGAEFLPEKTSEECLRSPRTQMGNRERLARIQDYSWVDV